MGYARKIEPESVEELLGCEYRLAIARNLRRLYTDVLDEPIPTDLRDLIARLEAQRDSDRRSLIVLREESRQVGVHEGRPTRI